MLKGILKYFEDTFSCYYLCCFLPNYEVTQNSSLQEVLPYMVPQAFSALSSVILFQAFSVWCSRFLWIWCSRLFWIRCPWLFWIRCSRLFWIRCSRLFWIRCSRFLRICVPGFFWIWVFLDLVVLNDSICFNTSN